MLDPWIIEEIRRRDERHWQDERPALEIPVGPPPGEDQEVKDEVGEEEVERGVVIVDFSV